MSIQGVSPPVSCAQGRLVNEMHAHKIYVTEVHACEVYAPECARCTPAGSKVYTCEVNVYEVSWDFWERSLYPVVQGPPDSAPISRGLLFSPHITIRVKRAPKPDPVKAPTFQPVAAFYFMELAVPLVYIFVSSHVLANVANAAPLPGYRRDPPRRFVFSSSAAPTAPPGQHC